MNAAKRVSIEALSSVGLPHTKLERQAHGGVAELTIEDLGWAASGLSEARYAAWSYVYRLDDRSRPLLWGVLIVAAAELSRRERWPLPGRDETGRRVPHHRYLRKLVELVLTESRYPRDAGNAKMRQIWWAQHPEPSLPWDGAMAQRYEALWQVFQRLLADACSLMSHAANRCDED